ncbi:hypothetical protein BY996DRAFT_6427024 [Phakopsora pachyrhizi]|nr:hypothetical protein BY996DRAFT_6427024 [Phakopsora pachyrhizi]
MYFSICASFRNTAVGIYQEYSSNLGTATAKSDNPHFLDCIRPGLLSIPRPPVLSNRKQIKNTTCAQEYLNLHSRNKKAWFKIKRYQPCSCYGSLICFEKRIQLTEE